MSTKTHFKYKGKGKLKIQWWQASGSGGGTGIKFIFLLKEPPPQKNPKVHKNIWTWDNNGQWSLSVDKQMKWSLQLLQPISLGDFPGCGTYSENSGVELGAFPRLRICFCSGAALTTKYKRKTWKKQTVSKSFNCIPEQSSNRFVWMENT